MVDRTAPAGEDPRIARSRVIILRAAHDHFVSHGYVGANVDLIAAEAGVAKRTVYNIYGGKEQLFRAVLDDAIGIAEHFSREIVDGLATDGLDGIAVRLARTVTSDRIVSLRRLLIGEATRFPELALDYYERAPGLIMRTLAAHLATLDELTVPDPDTAARHFAFLVIGAPLDRALFDHAAVPPGSLDRQARSGVAAFRRAYS